MKTIIAFTITLLLSFNQVFAQENIQLSQAGFNEVVFNATQSDNITYQRIIDWVNSTYKNPEKVIVGNVADESVIISGYMDNAWHYKSLGIEFYYDMTYKIYIRLKDGVVTFQFADETHTLSGGSAKIFPAQAFYNKKGEYKEAYNTGKATLEESINALYLSFKQKVGYSSLTNNEAIEQLKKAKEKLDLGLITQEQYDLKKAELTPFIK